MGAGEVLHHHHGTYAVNSPSPLTWAILPCREQRFNFPLCPLDTERDCRLVLARLALPGGVENRRLRLHTRACDVRHVAWCRRMMRDTWHFVFPAHDAQIPSLSNAVA
jgi:hypothetical protein